MEFDPVQSDTQIPNKLIDRYKYILLNRWNELQHHNQTNKISSQFQYNNTKRRKNRREYGIRD